MHRSRSRPTAAPALEPAVVLTTCRTGWDPGTSGSDPVAKADELGIDLNDVNLGIDTDKTVSEVQSATARRINGLIIAVPDRAADAKFALLTGAAEEFTKACWDQETTGSCPRGSPM
ncbi:hypothetical protein [Streptomyces sp. CB03911]|uniref:hypothetical protein n=1 Tax=Streptomyces sp. CB03911 TaxID=1804758 RepID=UPI0018FEE886|nr:hypothetical protein [Streptomyces sp. CB03911]